jgi:hypothetical protein
MKVLSIDIGLKNLAICLIDEKLNIYDWKVLDISSNSKKQTIENIADNIHTVFDTNMESWGHIDNVIIENQPVLKNPTMKTVQILVYSYFHMQKKHSRVDNLHFVSAKGKLCVENVVTCTKYKSKYRNHKMTSILTTKEYLKNNDTQIAFFNENTKKDDLSDCFLQSVYFLQKL